MSTIQLEEIAEYTFRIDLDEIVNTIRVYWSEFSDTMTGMETDGFWSLDISNNLFTIKGIKLVGGVELMWPYSQIGFGGFFLYDMSNENLDPEFAAIGTRWQLDYIPIDELQAFRDSLGLENI